MKMMGDAGVHGDMLAPSIQAWQRSRAKQYRHLEAGSSERRWMLRTTMMLKRSRVH